MESSFLSSLSKPYPLGNTPEAAASNLRKDLDVIAKNRYVKVNEEGTFEGIGLIEWVREYVMGLLGYVDHSKIEILRYRLQQLLAQAAERELLTIDDCVGPRSLITQVGKKVGLIPSRVSSKETKELNDFVRNLLKKVASPQENKVNLNALAEHYRARHIREIEPHSLLWRIVHAWDKQDKPLDEKEDNQGAFDSSKEQNAEGETSEFSDKPAYHQPETHELIPSAKETVKPLLTIPTTATGHNLVTVPHLPVRSPVKERTINTVELLEKLSHTDDLRDELQKLTPSEEISYKELYLRNMLTNALVRQDYDHLVNHWVAETLSLSNNWSKDWVLRASNLDTALRFLDFKNSLALLVAGYRLACLTKNEEEKELDPSDHLISRCVLAKEAFGSRLKALIDTHPDEFLKLNVTSFSPKVLTFDKSILNYQFLKLLADLEKMRLENEKVVNWYKRLGVALVGASALLGGITYKAIKEFTYVPPPPPPPVIPETAYVDSLPGIGLAVVALAVGAYALHRFFPKNRSSESGNIEDKKNKGKESTNSKPDEKETEGKRNKDRKPLEGASRVKGHRRYLSNSENSPTKYSKSPRHIRHSSLQKNDLKKRDKGEVDQPTWRLKAFQPRKPKPAAKIESDSEIREQLNSDKNRIDYVLNKGIVARAKINYDKVDFTPFGAEVSEEGTVRIRNAQAAQSERVLFTLFTLHDKKHLLIVFKNTDDTNCASIIKIPHIFDLQFSNDQLLKFIDSFAISPTGDVSISLIPTSTEESKGDRGEVRPQEKETEEDSKTSHEAKEKESVKNPLVAQKGGFFISIASEKGALLNRIEKMEKEFNPESSQQLELKEEQLRKAHTAIQEIENLQKEMESLNLSDPLAPTQLEDYFERYKREIRNIQKASISLTDAWCAHLNEVKEALTNKINDSLASKAGYEKLKLEKDISESSDIIKQMDKCFENLEDCKKKLNSKRTKDVILEAAETGQLKTVIDATVQKITENLNTLRGLPNLLKESEVKPTLNDERRKETPQYLGRHTKSHSASSASTTKSHKEQNEDKEDEKKPEGTNHNRSRSGSHIPTHALNVKKREEEIKTEETSPGREELEKSYKELLKQVRSLLKTRGEYDQLKKEKDTTAIASVLEKAEKIYATLSALKEQLPLIDTKETSTGAARMDAISKKILKASSKLKGILDQLRKAENLSKEREESYGDSSQDEKLAATECEKPQLERRHRRSLSSSNVPLLKHQLDLVRENKEQSTAFLDRFQNIQENLVTTTLEDEQKKQEQVRKVASAKEEISLIGQKISKLNLPSASAEEDLRNYIKDIETQIESIKFAINNLNSIWQHKINTTRQVMEEKIANLIKEFSREYERLKHEKDLRESDEIIKKLKDGFAELEILRGELKKVLSSYLDSSQFIEVSHKIPDYEQKISSTELQLAEAYNLLKNLPEKKPKVSLSPKTTNIEETQREKPHPEKPRSPEKHVKTPPASPTSTKDNELEKDEAGRPHPKKTNKAEKKDKSLLSSLESSDSKKDREVSGEEKGAVQPAKNKSPSVSPENAPVEEIEETSETTGAEVEKTDVDGAQEAPSTEEKGQIDKPQTPPAASLTPKVRGESNGHSAHPASEVNKINPPTPSSQGSSREDETGVENAEEAQLHKKKRRRKKNKKTSGSSSNDGASAGRGQGHTKNQNQRVVVKKGQPPVSNNGKKK